MLQKRASAQQSRNPEWGSWIVDYVFQSWRVEVLHMVVQSHIAYSLNLSVAPAVVPVATISTYGSSI